jgi:hemoglobin
MAWLRSGGDSHPVARIPGLAHAGRSACQGSIMVSQAAWQARRMHHDEFPEGLPQMNPGNIGASLYARLGGESGLEEMLAEFYGRVLADPQLEPFFRLASMNKLRQMQREFFGAALGGPQAYSGLSLSWVHAGRGIKTRHFNLFCQHLLETLRDRGVASDDIQEVVHRVSVHKNDITGESY